MAASLVRRRVHNCRLTPWLGRMVAMWTVVILVVLGLLAALTFPVEWAVRARRDPYDD